MTKDELNIGLRLAVLANLIVFFSMTLVRGICALLWMVNPDFILSEYSFLIGFIPFLLCGGAGYLCDSLRDNEKTEAQVDGGLFADDLAHWERYRSLLGYFAIFGIVLPLSLVMIILWDFKGLMFSGALLLLLVINIRFLDTPFPERYREASLLLVGLFTLFFAFLMFFTLWVFIIHILELDFLELGRTGLSIGIGVCIGLIVVFLFSKPLLNMLEKRQRAARAREEHEAREARKIPDKVEREPIDQG